MDAEMEAMDESASSSDESDLSDAVEVSDEDYNTIMALEGQLNANPNEYNKHVQYIALLRKSKMGERCRAARQAMHALFPFAETLWLEWLEDEIQAVGSGSSSADVTALFELAVQDYLSVPVWAKYISYLDRHVPVAQRGSEAGLQRFRDVAERALTGAGLHVTQGHHIWDAYREFEVELAAVRPQEETQIQRARALFHRQLQVPLSSGPQTLAEHGRWEASLPDALSCELPAGVRQGYEKAQSAVQQRAPSEEAVASDKPADMAMLAAYMAYINLEKEAGDPARVQMMYERAVAAFPVTHVLWLQYGRYLEETLKLPDPVNAAYARAVRNCPWIGALWARRIRALDRQGAPEEEVAQVYDRARQAGLQAEEDLMEVILARLDALRHKGEPFVTQLRDAFRAATDLMPISYPGYVDRTLRIPAYWANWELRVAKDAPAARAIWEAALKTPLKRYVEVVAGYIAMEVAVGNYKEARSLYRRFYSRHFEEHGQVGLCEAWLRFEREHGSADDLFQAGCKLEPILAHATAQAIEAANAAVASEVQAAAKAAPKLTKEEVQRMRQERDPNFKGGKAAGGRAPTSKRKAGLGFKEEGQQGNAKRARQEGPNGVAHPSDHNLQPSISAATQGKEGGEAQPVDAQAQRDDITQQEAASSSQAGGLQADGAAAKRRDVMVASHQRMAYVQGLGPGVRESELRALLEPCGPIAGLGWPLDHSTGEPKGFAYVAFESAEGLTRALQLPNPELSCGPISIEASRQKVAPDQRVAFVLGLDQIAQASDLEALFEECGPITSVRLPLDKQTSRPRGFAYVEFGSAEALQHCVEMSGVLFQGKALKISVSTPVGHGGGSNPRGGSNSRGDGNPRGRGFDGRRGSRGRGDWGRGDWGRGDRGRGGRGPFQGPGQSLSESQQPEHATATRHHLDLGGGASAGGPPQNAGGRSNRNGGAPKSNSDFRNMFLKK